MTALFAKLERPAITDLALTWPVGAEVYPRSCPISTTASRSSSARRSPAIRRRCRSSGRRGKSAWGTLLPTGGGEPSSGIGALWARERISALSDSIVEGAPEDEVRPLIVATALEHHLVSKYTSLVAVDVTPIAPLGTDPERTLVPGLLPAGLDASGLRRLVAADGDARPAAADRRPPAARRRVARRVARACASTRRSSRSCVAPTSRAACADMNANAPERGGPFGPMTRERPKHRGAESSPLGGGAGASRCRSRSAPRRSSRSGAPSRSSRKRTSARRCSKCRGSARSCAGPRRRRGPGRTRDRSRSCSRRASRSKGSCSPGRTDGRSRGGRASPTERRVPASTATRSSPRTAIRTSISSPTSRSATRCWSSAWTACACLIASSRRASPTRRRFGIPRDVDVPTLTLVTCWPFGAVNPGGTLRYVVVAEATGKPAGATRAVGSIRERML